MNTTDLKELKNVLFIDIETVSEKKQLNELEDNLKALWLKKASYLKNEEVLPDDEFYLKKAGIYAEFGKIICIGIGGVFEDESGNLALKVKTIYKDDESDLLDEFKQILEKHRAGKNLKLCAHNGKEFDFPYICRRMLIHGIELPKILKIIGKKPWEVPHLDTLELWKFGDYKHYTSLELLANIFGIPDSKSIMSGEQVNSVYYEEKNIRKITKYCSSDIIVLAQLYMKMNSFPLIDEENIQILESE